jgi:hypothetical protein
MQLTKRLQVPFIIDNSFGCFCDELGIAISQMLHHGVNVLRTFNILKLGHNKVIM